MARKTTLTRFALAAAVTGGLLTGCTSDDESLTYQTDYSNHRPLRVVGYPSTWAPSKPGHSGSRTSGTPSGS
jgi:hypothetical protein